MPANKQRLKSVRVCPPRLCECLYSDGGIERHMSMFRPLVSDCQRCRGESWDRCPVAFPFGTDRALVALCDLSQPYSESSGPPCHGRLPYAIDSLGPLCGFFESRSRNSLGYITYTGNVLPPFFGGYPWHRFTGMQWEGSVC